MLGLWGEYDGLVVLVAVLEALALAALLTRGGRRGGSSLAEDATRLGLRAAGRR